MLFQKLVTWPPPPTRFPWHGRCLFWSWCSLLLCHYLAALYHLCLNFRSMIRPLLVRTTTSFVPR